jgi:hypothetical protein
VRSISVLARGAVLAALAIGLLALAAPAVASASVHSGVRVTAPHSKPTPATAPRGGTPTPGGTLAFTGPGAAIVALLALGGALVIGGAALNRAGRKTRPTSS